MEQSVEAPSRKIHHPFCSSFLDHHYRLRNTQEHIKKSYTQLNVERRSLGLFLEVTYSLLLSLHCVPVAASGAPHTCTTH